MEESSEKRRERLQAMRSEASSSSSSSSSQSPASPSLPPPPFQPLSNPLLQPPPLPLSGDERSPRFDFYTDPMTAFSGSKRRTGTPSCRTPPPSTNFSPPVRSHSPMSYSSPRPPSFHNSWRSPVPFPGSPNPNLSFYRCGSPVQFPQSPNPNPSFYRGGSGSTSLYSNSGRGSRGRSYGGRGRGGYGKELEHFYIKAMVKDPWRKLKPIVGNILVPMWGDPVLGCRDR